jgi:hypothetical protein
MHGSRIALATLLQPITLQQEQQQQQQVAADVKPRDNDCMLWGSTCSRSTATAGWCSCCKQSLHAAVAAGAFALPVFCCCCRGLTPCDSTHAATNAPPLACPRGMCNCKTSAAVCCLLLLLPHSHAAAICACISSSTACCCRLLTVSCPDERRLLVLLPQSKCSHGTGSRLRLGHQGHPALPASDPLHQTAHKHSK